MELNVTQEEFEAFLNLLDLDREKAGQKYEVIRLGLIKFFYARGCHTAEELADESLDKAIRKIYQMSNYYEGTPASYCYGVARKVYLEFTRRPKFEELKEVIEKIQTDLAEEDHYECFLTCLKQLPQNQYSLITRYYNYTKGLKKQIREELELELELTNESLRARIFRIKKNLQSCLKKCKK